MRPELWRAEPWYQCYKTTSFRITYTFYVFLYFILRRYKDPFFVLLKYGENVCNMEMRNFITLAPGGEESVPVF